jgi:hypothetical protein
MPDTPNTAALEQLVEAMETMAFISPLPAADDAPAPPAPRLVEMEFACPSYGAVRLVTGEAFGQMLAANLLGVEPSSQEALAGADDALRELMNITCGAVIRRFGLAADQRLHMSLPTVQPMESARQWTQFLAMPGVQVLYADGQTIAFQAVGLE